MSAYDLLDVGWLLAQFPFEVTYEDNGPAGLATIVQGAVSEFAGFYPSGAKGDRYFFDASVRSSSLGDPEDVMRLLSAALSRARLAHWIWRMEFELDDDTLVVNCGMKWSEYPEPCRCQYFDVEVVVHGILFTLGRRV